MALLAAVEDPESTLDPGPAPGSDSAGSALGSPVGQPDLADPAPPETAGQDADGANRGKAAPREPDRPPPTLGTPLPKAASPSPPAPASAPVQTPSPAPVRRSPQAGPTPLPLPLPAHLEVPPPPSVPLPPASVEEPVPPLLPTVVDPAPQDDSGEPPWIPPPRDTATPGDAAPPVEAGSGPPSTLRNRGDDAVLFEDLPWDFCGPRIGLTGLGGVTEPTTPSDAPVDAVADQAEYDRSQDVVTLVGAVQFTQGDQILKADRSVYDRRSGAVQAEGDIYVEYPGGRLTADSGRYSLQTKEGGLENVGFRLSGNANLRGTAGRAELLPGDRTQYRDVTYTTCPPGRSDWSLRASDLLLDHADGMGTARHARIRLAGVPVLYSPYLRFPIDDRRRSGFLIPSFGSSSLNGAEITVPYYWNIAPNYDATFYPRIMSSRGLMLGAQFRHLASFQKLEINGEVIPNDSKSEEEKTRGAIRVEQTGQLGPRWSTAVDYSSVTDDRYLADFGNRLDLTSLRNLPQRGDLTLLRRWLLVARPGPGLPDRGPDDPRSGAGPMPSIPM